MLIFFTRTPVASDRLQLYQDVQAFAIEIMLQVTTPSDPVLYFLSFGLATLDNISPGDRLIVKPLLDR